MEAVPLGVIELVLDTDDEADVVWQAVPDFVAATLDVPDVEILGDPLEE